MSLLFFSIGICILLLIIILGCVSVGIKHRRMKKSGYALSFFSLAGLLFLLLGSFAKIPANSVGIIFDDRSGIKSETYKEGFVHKSIFEHITIISTTNRTATIHTTGQTNDGQYATFEISLIYRIDANDAGLFYKKTGSDDIKNDALNSLVKTSLQSSTINYNIFEILSTELDKARNEFFTTLKDSLYENYYITLINASFDDVDAGQEVESILQQKAEADQQIEIAKKNAEASLITAKNEAEIEKTLADAQAYAISAKGTAEGEADAAYIHEIMKMIDTVYENMNGQMTYAECSEMILSIIFYNTWDGKLPEVVTSDELSTLIGGLLK